MELPDLITKQQSTESRGDPDASGKSSGYVPKVHLTQLVSLVNKILEQQLDRTSKSMRYNREKFRGYSIESGMHVESAFQVFCTLARKKDGTR